ncbi:MAG: hypothetical protein KAS99_03970 [Candidatus Omnitrophica bacterium]|nr:hypothetical protein [Candidatus Omnitrophota bacterium]
MYDSKSESFVLEFGLPENALNFFVQWIDLFGGFNSVLITLKVIFVRLDFEMLVYPSKKEGANKLAYNTQGFVFCA